MIHRNPHGLHKVRRMTCMIHDMCVDACCFCHGRLSGHAHKRFVLQEALHAYLVHSRLISQESTSSNIQLSQFGYGQSNPTYLIQVRCWQMWSCSAHGIACL